MEFEMFYTFDDGSRVGIVHDLMNAVARVENGVLILEIDDCRAIDGAVYCDVSPFRVGNSPL